MELGRKQDRQRTNCGSNPATVVILVLCCVPVFAACCASRGLLFSLVLLLWSRASAVHPCLDSSCVCLFLVVVCLS